MPFYGYEREWQNEHSQVLPIWQYFFFDSITFSLILAAPEGGQVREWLLNLGFTS